IAAFRKQLEVNPYDEWAHNLLGSVYWRQQKYERAAAAFRKQLEINPLDEYAYGSLGSMYCEWRKYDEAVPLLEKAVSLKPDNAPYHVSLGEAYLNLNQPDKALEAFDRAVEILPVPGIWNNVAYELSRHRAHLGRAQRYAESAIAATAASLRNVTLDRLRAEDLGQVSAIGSFWDTLGWIHFQNGDLEQAERFIRAAWELSQHGEVGHHLAQVYEKRGNKEEAIRTYAMALAASRPPMETRQRLAALVGGDQRVDGLVEKARSELAGVRTLKLGPLVKGSAEAEFFVLLAPGPKVEAVKFIRGSEKLRGFTGTLQATSLSALFPDATPTKLVRRGVLSCTDSNVGCSFVLFTPDDVHSVN
ncbi:MAG TPA: tetratricopeptide repeat protein, partial [Longimicrobiales bacterium]|nr:tetratricopeptide repeat protein [Longimicrobiales bacterium]